jgi:TonB family protein
MLVASTLAALVLQIGDPNGTGGIGQATAQWDYLRHDLDNEQAARSQSEPKILNAPDATDLQRVYPRDALTKNLSGETKIHCTVDKTGSLTRCSIVAETPKDLGFGSAALELSKAFKFSTKTADGSIIGHGMTIPIRFTPPAPQ